MFAEADEHPVLVTRRDGETLVLMSRREDDARTLLLQIAADLLTRTPTTQTPTSHPLRSAELGTVTRNGKDYERWQHKPTRQGDARIWFYVDGQSVYLEQVHTTHPHQTT